MLTPAKKFYPQEQTPIAAVDYRLGFREDLYLVLGDFARDGSHATIKVQINRMVSWLWIGGLVLTLGTALAIAPERKRAPALPRPGQHVADLDLRLAVLPHPGVHQHPVAELGEERPPRAHVDRDRPARCECPTHVLEVAGPDGPHAVELGVPVERGVGERHPASRRRRRGVVVDDDAEPVTNSSVGNGRGCGHSSHPSADHIAGVANSDIGHRRHHAPWVTNNKASSS